MIAWISRTLHVSENRAESFLYAAPWVVFLLTGPVGILASHTPTFNEWAFIACQLVFLPCYLATWLMNDPAPRGTRFPPRLLAALSSLVLLTVIGLVLSPAAIFNFPFIVTVVLLLFPRSSIWIAFLTMTGVVALVVIPVTIRYPSTTPQIISSYFGTALLMIMIRKSIDRDTDATLTLMEDKNEAARIERDRMASDLHDILGQTLTAISTMSQLSAKLIDANKLDEARETSAKVAALSRDALAQMRAVVHSRQTLSIEEELAGARLLAQGAGVNLTVAGALPDLTPEEEDLVAHTIRESLTNVIHHSRASSCHMSFTDTGVTICNDGVRATNDEDTRIGHGLANLRKRASGIGTIDAGKHGREWCVRLTLKPNAEGGA